MDMLFIYMQKMAMHDGYIGLYCSLVVDLSAPMTNPSGEHMY